MAKGGTFLTMIRLAGGKGIRAVLRPACLVLSKGKDSRRVEEDGGVRACVLGAKFM